ncbi:putative U2 small nuclear ribonucleoprotein A' [Acanthocheilonema viteae]
MVRLTVELINDSLQYLNTVRDRELSLRACKIPVLENLGVTKDQFDTIDLTDNDIRKLENIPLLRRLSTLLMHNNRVQQIMPNIGEALPSLKTLALTNNNLCELDDIDPLATCPKLEYLTLIGNPVTHKPQYRLYVIYKVPSVRVLDFKRVRLAERKQANSFFKGKKGQKFREEVMRKSRIVPDDEEDGLARNLRAEDAKKIEEAIASASSLAEVERLQAILQSGRIPESGWNRGSIDNVAEEDTRRNAEESNGFVVEQEDEGDDVPSPLASPTGDLDNDVQSPISNPPEEKKLDNGQMEYVEEK